MEKREFTDGRRTVADHIRANHAVLAGELAEAWRAYLDEGVLDIEEMAGVSRRYHGCLGAAARHLAIHHQACYTDAIVEAVDDGYVPNVQFIAFALNVEVQTD